MAQRSWFGGAVLAVLVTMGCGPSGDAPDAGAPRFDGAVADAGLDGAAGPDGSAGLDGATGPMDAGGPTDGGPMGGPTPPAGTSRCGGGTVTDEQRHDACALVDPISELGTDTPTDCDALTVAAGVRYEVWCSDTTFYLWVGADAVDDPVKQSCTLSIPVDGGVLSFSVQQFRWSDISGTGDVVALQSTSGMRVVDSASTYASWTSSGVSGGMERPWRLETELELHGLTFAPTEGGTGTVALRLMQADCGGIPVADTSAFVMVLPIAWSAP